MWNKRRLLAGIGALHDGLDEAPAGGKVLPRRPAMTAKPLIVVDPLPRTLDQICDAETRRRLETYCRELKAAGLEAEPRQSIGKPVPEVLRLSREYQASMIVLGKTGKDWFQQYFMGGVSHRIAEASELPVLVVP